MFAFLAAPERPNTPTGPTPRGGFVFAASPEGPLTPTSRGSSTSGLTFLASPKQPLTPTGPIAGGREPSLMATGSGAAAPLISPKRANRPTGPPGPCPRPPGARKLPIKRRSPRPSSSPPSSSSSASSDPLRAPTAGGGGRSDQQQPPFKFQRIWSESDELRFLQGLLGCGAQGLIFPRDLNRFSESMPQPYTRAQLSEKLRRLKNKYRSVSARVAGGLDPARLAPHDRDVLHLCSRLWDPANAATSPFASGAGSSGNKRRRANPRGTPLPPPDASGDCNSHDYNGISSSAPGLFPEVSFA
ncbi:uncharacterized protein [Setaria viridis]